MFSNTRIQIGLNAEPERVFRALTESTALRAWFCEHAEVDLTQDRYDFWGKFTPQAPDRNAGRHAIVESIPGQVLAYRWQVGGDGTRVTYRLYPHANGTTLTLRHAPDGEQSPEPGGFEDFWFLSLENLRRYLDGKPSDARIDYTHPMRGDIRHETEIDAPLARVFEVLTHPDELNRWIATHAKVQPEKGGEYNLGWMYGRERHLHRLAKFRQLGAFAFGIRRGMAAPDFGIEARLARLSRRDVRRTGSDRRGITSGSLIGIMHPPPPPHPAARWCAARAGSA
jgi:uncharacterized protein YndB with AHSA1/START domain